MKQVAVEILVICCCSHRSVDCLQKKIDSYTRYFEYASLYHWAVLAICHRTGERAQRLQPVSTMYNEKGLVEGNLTEELIGKKILWWESGSQCK